MAFLTPPCRIILKLSPERKEEQVMACAGCELSLVKAWKLFHEDEDAALACLRQYKVQQLFARRVVGSANTEKTNGVSIVKRQAGARQGGRRRAVLSLLRDKEHGWIKYTYPQAITFASFIYFHGNKKKKSKRQLFFGFNSESVVRQSSCCHKVCELWLGQQQQPGGSGKVVEIDESKFGRSKCGRGKDVSGKGVFRSFREKI